MNSVKNSELEAVRRNTSVVAVKEQLSPHLEGSLSKKARIMFAWLVSLVVNNAISPAKAREKIAFINAYNANPTPENETSVYSDLPVRNELTEFELELIADIKSLEDKGVLKSDASEHLRLGLFGFPEPITPGMVREFLKTLFIQEKCIMNHEARKVIAKYR